MSDSPYPDLLPGSPSERELIREYLEEPGSSPVSSLKTFDILILSPP